MISGNEGDTESNEGIWLTANKKGNAVVRQNRKRPRTKSSITDQESTHTRSPPVINLKVVVTGLENKNICNVNPVKIVKSIHEKVGQVQKVTKERKALHIHCKNKKQVSTLLEFNELAD